MCWIPRYPGIQGLSMISAMGIFSSFSRRDARLNVSHCAASMTIPPLVPAVQEHAFYAANGNNNTIVKFTSGGSGSVFASTGLSPSGLVGLAFDSAGNLYAANFNTNTVQKFTPGGVGSIFAGGGGLRAPFELAFDSA